MAVHSVANKSPFNLFFYKIGFNTILLENKGEYEERSDKNINIGV